MAIHPQYLRIAIEWPHNALRMTKQFCVAYWIKYTKFLGLHLRTIINVYFLANSITIRG